MFSLLYLLSGVLGVLVSDFFFAFQLLDVIPRSKLLQYVLKSVTQNGISIILTVRADRDTYIVISCIIHQNDI